MGSRATATNVTSPPRHWRDQRHLIAFTEECGRVRVALIHGYGWVDGQNRERPSTGAERRHQIRYRRPIWEIEMKLPGAEELSIGGEEQGADFHGLRAPRS